MSSHGVVGLLVRLIADVPLPMSPCWDSFKLFLCFFLHMPEQASKFLVKSNLVLYGVGTC